MTQPYLLEYARQLVYYTGASYDDELSDDSLIYHYPSTRSPGRDSAEIEATKAASALGLPLYAIVGSSNPREIR